MARIDGSAADPMVREILMVSGAVEAAKKGRLAPSRRSRESERHGAPLKRIGEPSSRENVADDGSYEDRHDRLS